MVTSANLGKVLKLDRSAKIQWATIKADGDNYILDNKGLPPAVRADMSERNFKVTKLAGIYAFFEGCDDITARHMNEAFEVIKESSRVLVDLRRIRPLHTRLLESMLEESKPCTSQHYLSYSYINSTWSKKILEILDLAKQLASEKGYLWKEVSRKSVLYYEVSKPTKKEDKVLDEVDKDDELSAEQQRLIDMLN